MNKKTLIEWENDLRKLGYTNQDIIDIAMNIIKAYDYGRTYNRSWFVKLLVKWLKL